MSDVTLKSSLIYSQANQGTSPSFNKNPAILQIAQILLQMFSLSFAN